MGNMPSSSGVRSDVELSNDEMSALLAEITEGLPNAPKAGNRVVVLGDFNNEFVSSARVGMERTLVSFDRHTVTDVSCSIDKYHKDAEGYDAKDRQYVLDFHARSDAESILVDQSVERRGWRGGDTCLAGPPERLRVAKGGVPSVADQRDRLPASDHAPMSYLLEQVDGGQSFRALVYNICWEIFEPGVAVATDRGSGPTGRILVPLASKCSANVLSNITTLCADHDLVALQEVPIPLLSGGGGDDAASEKALAWARIREALDSIETHGYLCTERAFSGLVLLYKTSRFTVAPSGCVEGGTEPSDKAANSRPYQAVSLLDASDGGEPLHVYHLHCGNRFRPKYLRKRNDQGQ